MKPNFGATAFKIKIYDELTIEDQNNVMDEYNLETSNNTNYTVHDNKITVKMNNAGSSTLIFRKNSKRYTNSAIFYVSDKYRDAMQIGKFESISYNVSITSICGKVFITTSKEQLTGYQDNEFIYDYQPNKNSVYHLYAKEDIYNNKGELLYKKDEKVSELIAGESDSFNNLYPSNYYVKEVSNAYPYVVNKEIFDVNLDIDNKYQTLSFKSDLPRATVSFKNLKQDVNYSSNDVLFNYTPSSGIEFGLYNSEDIYSTIDQTSPIVKKDTLLGTSKSDYKGVVTFNLDIPLGSYYIKKLTEDNMYHGNFAISSFDFTFNSENSNRQYNLKDYYNLLNTKNMTFNNKGKNNKIDIYNQDKILILSKNIEENLIIELPYGEYFYQTNNQELTPFIVGDSSSDTIEVVDDDNEDEKPLTNKIPGLIPWGGTNTPPREENNNEFHQNHLTHPDEEPKDIDENEDDEEQIEESPNEEEQDKKDDTEESKEEDNTEIIEEDSKDKEDKDNQEENHPLDSSEVDDKGNNDKENTEEDLKKEEENFQVPNNQEDNDNEESNNDDANIEEPKEDEIIDKDKPIIDSNESSEVEENPKEDTNESPNEEDNSNITGSPSDNNPPEASDENDNEEKDLSNNEVSNSNIPSVAIGSINDVLNVKVPATDSFDLIIYISLIMLVLSSILYVNVKN